MKPRHKVSRAAIELIKRFEGYRQVAARLPDGGWTIGYGHTRAAREGARVSEQDAEALLLYDLIPVARGVDELLHAPVTQNQFDALCAFAFNVGLDSFRRSAVLRRMNEGASIEAAFAMELWRKAEFEGEPIVVDALIRRRAAEKLLFLTPPDGWTPAPTPVLRPLPDEVRDFAPREPALEIAVEPAGAEALARRAADLPPPVTEAELSVAGPSPVEAAAEQVSARLQTLFADAPDAPDAPPPPAEPQAPAEPAPAPAEESAPEPIPPEVDEYAPTRDLFEPEVVDAEEAAPVFDRPRRRAAKAVGYPSILALALPGAAFFAAAALWAAGRQPVAGLVTPLAVAVLGAVAGVLMLGIAAYLLMRKLGLDAEAAGRRG